MDEQINQLEYVLMGFEPERVGGIEITNYEDVSYKLRQVYSNTSRYYNVWGTIEGISHDIVDYVSNMYDTYESAFKSYLDKNDITYIDVEIFTEGDNVTFSVTIEII